MINIFTASGNVGKDMELRYTPNGKAIGSFSLPVKQGYGEYEKTSWVGVKLFGKRAEALNGKITKGSLVFVTGEFVLEEWEKDGTKHSFPTILCNEIQIAPRAESAGKGSGSPSENPAGGQGAGEPPQIDDDFDDSLPF